jgi:hypothetical protein
VEQPARIVTIAIHHIFMSPLLTRVPVCATQ